MTKKYELSVFERQWEKNNNAIWLATTLCLQRNIAKFHFPEHLEAEKRIHVMNLLQGVLTNAQSIENVDSVTSELLSPTDRDFLFEHFLLFKAVSHSQKGQLSITEKSGTILIQVNHNDHMRLHCIELKGELEKALEKLICIEKEVEKQLPFAFSNQYGYLTSDPCCCGTGLIVTAYVHVPGLVYKNTFSQVTEKHQEGLVYTSLEGDTQESVGDLLVIKNLWTLGLKEETILSSIRTAVLHIIAEEQSARKEIQEIKKDQLFDCLGRAIGTLQNAYTIDTRETLNMLSLIKLGVSLGWIHGIDVENLNGLFCNCRRAHLAKRLQLHDYSREHIHKERASFLRTIFSSVRLEST